MSRGQGPGKERHLREPGALLDAWVKQLAASRVSLMRRYYVPSLKSDALIERLSQVMDGHQVGYAVTYEAAAQRYAPFLSGISQVSARLLPSAGTDAAIAELDARVVNEGQTSSSSRRSRRENCYSASKSEESGLRAPFRSISTYCVAKVVLRRWPNTCVKRGSISDGQARDTR